MSQTDVGSVLGASALIRRSDDRSMIQSVPSSATMREVDGGA